MSEQPKIRIGSQGPNRAQNARMIEIDGLTSDEQVQVRGSIEVGSCWIRKGPDGRLQTSPTLEAPLPETDPEMLPFWLPLGEKSPEGFPNLIHLSPESLTNRSASFTITSLCGYNYTPENYQLAAQQLRAFGFVCLRSQRGADGRYMEHWYLPGLFWARGRLKTAITEKTDEVKKVEQALAFFRNNWDRLNFGSLCISIQRLAMGIPE